MPKKTLFISFILFSMCFPYLGNAQTARWLLKPEYQNITPFGETYYKTNTYSTMAIYNTNGEKLIEADSITYITNGYALALNYVNGKFRLIAVIDKSLNIKNISEEYYVEEHHFFSEDLLGVSNKKGKCGYINPDGKLDIPCKYAAVHPFREGLASVSKPQGGIKGLVGSASNKKLALGAALYVNHKGAEVEFRDGKLYPTLATSFKDGKALVQMEDGRTFYISPKGMRITNGPSNTDIVVNDNYEYSEGNITHIVNLPYMPTYNAAYTIKDEGSLKGYMANGVLMMPSQFQEALGFASGFAIVKKDGKYGVLKQLSGTIDIKVTEKGGKISVKGMIPAEWDNCQAKFIRITNGTERLSFAMNGKESQRTLEGDVPVSNGVKTYEVDIDGLIVWRQSGKEPDSSPNPGSINVRAPVKITANTKGECVVNVRVTNNTGSAQTIAVSLSTGGSKSIKLGAGKSGSVSITTKISKPKETKCSVTAKSAGGNASCTTTLVPSFIL